MKRKLTTYHAMLAPYTAWAVLFILVPLAFVGYYAFTDNDFNFTLEHFIRFFTATSNVTGDDGVTREVRTYVLIFLRSVKLAVISTAICLLLGYPLAYIMSKATTKVQKIMMTLIMIPMWMNFLIRTYAWMTILQDTGIFNNFLEAIGLDRIRIIGTETAVIIGMVYDYFPYMVMPIYSILAKMDNRLLEAARDLGCGSFSVLRRVVFPLSLPGVISGITMVLGLTPLGIIPIGPLNATILIPSISTFYISQKLGNGKFYLIGDAIEGQYIANNLHFAAAIAFILMVILLAAMALVKYASERYVYGGES